VRAGGRAQVAGNFSAVSNDLKDMTCDRWIEAISATVDGEDPGVDPRLLDAHLQSCASCRAYRDTVESTRRKLRVTIAQPVPDLSRRIVKINRLRDRSGRWAAARLVLGVVAAQIIVLAIPSLFLSDPSKSVVHAGRHLSAFSIAYAVGLLVVVARPARARTLLPVAEVLCGALFITSIADVATGSVPLVNEMAHLPELFSAVLLWILAVPAPRGRIRTAAKHDRLRLADDDNPAHRHDQAM
jgi:predicted anti-sigma-YlaC factor YlaD